VSTELREAGQLLQENRCSASTMTTLTSGLRPIICQGPRVEVPGDGSTRPAAALAIPGRGNRRRSCSRGTNDMRDTIEPMPKDNEHSESGSFGWRSMRSSSLSVRIRGQILAFLADDGHEAGDRLPSERDLAVRLGVSRPSVREAIKTLEAEGRLDVRHGQGVFVASSSAGDKLRRSIRDTEWDLLELYAMREVLEVPAARWAAQRGQPGAIAGVKIAHDRLLTTSRQESVDLDQLQLLDAAFHQSIVQAAGNRFLEQTQGVLGEILVRGMSTTLAVPGRLEASRADHRAILEAITAGDGTRAAAAARRHVRAAHRAALTMVGDGGRPPR